MSLPTTITKRLSLPLIVAPMFQVSGPDLVIAACKAGTIGAFPTANCRSPADLEDWLQRFDAELGPDDAPFCPNLIMRSPNLVSDITCLLRHKVEFVITSVGSPKPIIPALHEAGCLVFADVASLHHAKRAVEAGVDGLILLTAGAGGQTGWANGFAFVRAVREFWNGGIVLAGGISDGTALFAAEALGCDLGYMGTSFIATHESMATPAYREMLVQSSLDDILLTRAFTGLDTSMLRPSIHAAGINPETLPASILPEAAGAMFGSQAEPDAPKRWTDIWSAGHSVSGVRGICSAVEKISDIKTEYFQARAHMRAALNR